MTARLMLQYFRLNKTISLKCKDGLQHKRCPAHQNKLQPATVT